MADTKQPLRTYRGNCHCGAFVYEINVPEVKSVAECNCSICYKKGYIRLFLEKKNFRVAKGDITQLSSYTFGGKRAEHQVIFPGRPLCICEWLSSRKNSSVRLVARAS